MIHRERKGTRVRIKPGVVTFYRTFPLGMEGFIEHELDNGIGRVLTFVLWDDLGISPVFDDEIEVLESSIILPPPAMKP